MSDMSAYSAPSTSRPSDQYSHLPKLPQAICQFMLEHPCSAEGVHVSAIARAVGSLADAEKIRYLDIVLCFRRILLTLVTAAKHWMASWTMVSSTQPLTTLTSNLQPEHQTDFVRLRTPTCLLLPVIYSCFFLTLTVISYLLLGIVFALA